MFDGPIENANLRYISLGAGVQSSVMALMAARGEIGPMPDCAVFADTQWEPKSVYDHLGWLETQLPFPVYRVTSGDIRAVAIGSADGDFSPGLPVFISTDPRGMVGRHCTNAYKIQPIQRKVREILGYAKGQRLPKAIQVEQWMGISRDEIQRVKDSRDWWVTNRWPLIEKMMSRHDCQVWFEENYAGRPLSRSACIGCPYRSDDSWRQMRDNDTISWADAVQFDHALRSGKRNAFSMTSPVYLHKSMTPLDEVDLSTEQDRGQLDMFGNECEGMCGV